MAYTGLYDANGQIIIVAVSGASYTGVYNADGSYNGVLDVTPTVYKGVYHPCGAYNIQVTTNPFAGAYAPDGARYVLATATGYTFAPLSGFIPAGIPNPANPPDLFLNFQTNTSFSRTVLTGTASSLLTVSRASAGLVNSANETWTSVASNLPRISDRGLLVEETRTNSIRTNDMTGAVAADSVELVTNGNFALDPKNASQSTVQNGWQWSNNAGTGTVVWNGSSAVTLTGDGTNNAQIGTAALTTVIGLTYTISADITASSVVVGYGTSVFALNIGNVTFSTGTSQKVQFVATTTTTFVTFFKTAAAATTISNVSVQSAGKLPNNWSTFNPGSLILTVTALGTTNGLNSLSYTLVGNAASTSIQFFLDSATQIAATYGQTWTYSAFLSMTNQTNVGIVSLDTRSNNSGGSTVNDNDGTVVPTTSLARYSSSLTPAVATTAFVQPLLVINYNGAVNFGGTFAAPQLENNNINSTVASAVVAAGGAGYAVNDTITLTGGAGTQAVLRVLTLNVTAVATVSVQSVGSYTTLPPSPAAQGSTSGVGVGATFTLTPTNNAASAFATSPIVTTSVAVTRAADVVTLTTPGTFGSAYTMYAAGTPQAPAAYGVNQIPMSINDTSTNNRLQLVRNATTGALGVFMASGGASQYNQTGGAWTQSTSAKSVVAATASDQQAAFNGALLTAGSGASMPVSPSIVNFGVLVNAAFFDGFIASSALWYTQRVPNAQLQSMTT